MSTGGDWPSVATALPGTVAIPFLKLRNWWPPVANSSYTSHLDEVKAARDYDGAEWGLLQERAVRSALPALIAIAEEAQELVTPCKYERGHCAAHGGRLPCPIAAISTALGFLL